MISGRRFPRMPGNLIIKESVDLVAKFLKNALTLYLLGFPWERTLFDDFTDCCT